MARADLLIDLVDAERCGDRARFRSVVEAVIADERAKSHNIVADRLAALLEPVDGVSDPRRRDRLAPAALDGLLHEISPRRRLGDLTLADAVASAVRDFVEEHHRVDLLHSYNIEPRHRILLAGPPGNGKTSLAEAIAAEMMLPLFVARYEGIVSSFLGESASRLDAVFEFARSRRCVLFFDEFDTIAKERADEHETGEIKRVVSTLLLQIDRLPAHVVAVVATNHSELLDRAAWRRFQLRLRINAPTRAAATEFIDRMRGRLGGDLGLAPRTLADRLKGSSFSDLEQFCLGVKRRHVLNLPDSDITEIAKTQIAQWRAQANGSS